MAIDLIQLRYFHTVAQHGNMTRAARALDVSQPTVTVAIKHLEAHLRTRLFHRDRQGIRLTATGQALLEQTRGLFGQLEAIEERIRGLETGEVGRFVIGCHTSVGAYFLPPFLSDFLTPESEIELVLWTGSSNDVWQAVLSREAHFGLVVDPRPHPDLVFVELFREPIQLFVKAENGKATRGLPAARDRLKRGPLLYAERIDQSRELLRRLSLLALAPTRLLQCGDFELVRSLTLAGIGVGMMPRRIAATPGSDDLRLLHPELPSVLDHVVLVYRADSHRTRAANRVKDALVQRGKAMRDELLDRAVGGA